MSWDATRLSSGCLLYRHPNFCAPPRRQRVKKMAAAAKPAPMRMPFGKYVGMPVDQVLIDRNYVGWLLAQPWFGEKFPEHRQYLEATYNITRRLLLCGCNTRTRKHVNNNTIRCWAQ